MKVSVTFEIEYTNTRFKIIATINTNRTIVGYGKTLLEAHQDCLEEIEVFLREEWRTNDQKTNTKIEEHQK